MKNQLTEKNNGEITSFKEYIKSNTEIILILKQPYNVSKMFCNEQVILRLEIHVERQKH